ETPQGQGRVPFLLDTSGTTKAERCLAIPPVPSEPVVIEFMGLLVPMEIDDPGIAKPIPFHVPLVGHNLTGPQIIDKDMRIAPHVNHVVGAVMLRKYLAHTGRDQGDAIASLRPVVRITRQCELAA